MARKRTNSPKFPTQPVVIVNGVNRFLENRVVTIFWEKATKGEKYTLHDAALDHAHGKFSREEMVQFAQLIGYSVSGWHDLSYVQDQDYRAAQKQVKLAEEREKP